MGEWSELTLHSTRASIIRWTTLVSLSRPFSTVITRSLRPRIVLLLAESLEDRGSSSSGPDLRFCRASSSIDMERRISRFVSDWTRIASCFRSRYARMRVSR
jgi:hypothetical protein